MRQNAAVLFGAFALLTMAQAGFAGEILYVGIGNSAGTANALDGSAEILNLTGVPSMIASVTDVGRPSNQGITGLVFDNLGNLWASTDIRGGTPGLEQINPSTGAQISTVALTTGGSALHLDDLAFDPISNVVYGLGTNGVLYKINTLTGVGTAVGPASVGRGGIGFTASGTLYMSGYTLSGTPQFALHVLNPDTGVVIGTPVALSGFYDGLAVSRDGTIYVNDGTVDGIYTINPSTGAATSVGCVVAGCGSTTKASDLAFFTTSATAAFRATSGAIELTSELSVSLSNAGGAFSSDPSAAQNATGDTFVVARDASNALWVNVFDARKQVWDGWVSGGGAIQGVPAIAAIGSTAYIAVRDASNAYWTNTFTRGMGWGGWTNRGGAFSTDPVIGTNALEACCTLYVVGKDNFNAIWAVTWLYPTFGTWTLRGATVQGKPSLTVGQDGAAYIAVRDNSNAVWMGRQLNTTFNGWQPAGGGIAIDPQAAAAGTVVYAAAITNNGGVWYDTFDQGTGNNWTGWVNAGGQLTTVTTAASVGPQLFLTGRDPGNQLWWYEAPGVGWKSAGGTGLAAGQLSASPR